MIIKIKIIILHLVHLIRLFEFSAQAYLMVCFYKCSVFLKDTSPYKLPFLNFSKEIENMFIEFKNDILNYPNKNL